MSGIVPAKIAASFTTAELAVLTVIGWHCRRSGACALPIDAIAALAGCSRSSVKNALRQAKILGLVHVRERRIPGRKSLTNIIRVISRDWLAWLRLGIGVKNLTATNNHSLLSRGETDRQGRSRLISPRPSPACRRAARECLT
jgi:hypothetical protein